MASTVARGSAFERATRHFLAREPFKLALLSHSGGANDHGVDLRGWWRPPSLAGSSTNSSSSGSGSGSRMGLRALVQCKAVAKPLGPRALRELEGVAAFERARASSFLPQLDSSDQHQQQPRREAQESEEAAISDLKGERELLQAPIVAFLASTAGFTPATTVRAHASPIALVLLHLSPPSSSSSSSSSSFSSDDDSLVYAATLDEVADEGRREQRYECKSLALNLATRRLLGSHVHVNWVRVPGGAGAPQLVWEHEATRETTQDDHGQHRVAQATAASASS